VYETFPFSFRYDFRQTGSEGNEKSRLEFYILFFCIVLRVAVIYGDLVTEFNEGSFSEIKH